MDDTHRPSQGNRSLAISGRDQTQFPDRTTPHDGGHRKTLGLWSPQPPPTDPGSTPARHRQGVSINVSPEPYPSSDCSTPPSNGQGPPLQPIGYTRHDQIRLNWIKRAVPWSKVSNDPWKLTHKISRRPMSATKKTLPIPEDLILTSARAQSLREVSCVRFHELPGYSLSTLSQCWNLVHLTVSHCGLICLDGMSACKHLLYIHAADNAIEFVDVRDLGSLQYLNMARNKLASVHGLEGCVNLRWLDLAHNKIRKIDNLSSLRRLHTLILSHNNVTSCHGLGQAPTLQHVDLSHNFIQTFTGVDKLCLLTGLSLRSNNLLQPPVLNNQVLLKWLDVGENSIQSLAPLAQYWLPVLHHLDVGTNRLDDMNGVENLPCLTTLDVTDNQISDLDSLTSPLQHCVLLNSLRMEGNPFLDDQDSQQRQDFIIQALPGLADCDGESMGGRTLGCPDYLKAYMAQIGARQSLEDGFQSQTGKVDTPPAYDPQALCSTTFHYCDTSFKMAVEHRSSQEYGDVHALYASLVTVASNATTASPSAVASVPAATNVRHSISYTQMASAKGHQVSDAADQPPKERCLDTSVPSRQNNAMSNGPDAIPTFPDASRRPPPNQVNVGITDSPNSHLGQHGHSSSRSPPATSVPVSTRGHSKDDQTRVHKEFKDNDEDTDSSDDLVDVTKDDLDHTGLKPNTAKHNGASPLPPPPSQNYLSEKDKFLMALEGGKGTGNALEYSGRREGAGPNTSTTSRCKKTFDGAGEVRDLQHGKNLRQVQGVKADVVGACMDLQADTEPVGQKLNEMLAETYDIDNFDLEKYLDIGELDEFLERGWRPEDSPQIPSSKYPVLGKINNQSWNPQQVESSEANRYQHSPSTPPPPRSNPEQAWVNLNHNNKTDSRASPLAIPPLLHPSPSPSSVASVAETLGGGSIKVRKKEELCEEWGFKDSRTADLMLARAKKMKYNSDKKRKLSRLDPQQRYQLFQKLEESSKVQTVRPRPAKTLPRKEYFQAREEEIHRQEFEREQEEKVKVHRTFEWLHTQVGDHPITSSRIHPGSGPAYSNQHATHRPQHSQQTSPDLDQPKLAVDDVVPPSFLSERRYSLGDGSSNSRSPLLPPISISSAPAYHSNKTPDKISFRNQAVAISGGWGGGKKRNGK